jgi:hypothetical protein
MEGLKAGMTHTVKADFSSGPVGSISSGIDVYDQVRERNEGNNELLIVFTPPPQCTPESGGAR